MKILTLNGSPKKKSDTMCMTGAFLDGMRDAGESDITVINAIELDVRPCLGCFACRTGGHRCVQRDDMAAVLEKIRAADVLLWSFPLYCYGMPSHLKALLDRLLPLSSPSMRQDENGVVSHPVHGDTDMLGKKYLMLCGCGFPASKGNFDPAVGMMRNAFGNRIVAVCVTEAPMFNAAEARSVTVPFLERMRAAGAEFVKTGSLSAKTVEALETPMIPNDVYIRIVNGN